MGVSLVATSGALYIGITRNRMFLPTVPVGAAVTWRLWTMLEDTWAYQRYVDNAAKIRNERRANPMQSVVKRRVATKEPTFEELEEKETHGTALTFS
ncbi:hypothetical protein AGDE_04375 [Angomonas deanei]|nr:hypothetical protein AGDE_04375 [Angomonas deanei]|eukprot:EPY39553.1 hypothetical protein AGDE_04375 [Angomonas deanei]